MQSHTRYSYVDNSVLTFQTTAHVKRNTISRTRLCWPQHERKELHKNEYNLHESEMIPTTNSILIPRLLIAN